MYLNFAKLIKNKSIKRIFFGFLLLLLFIYNFIPRQLPATKNLRPNATDIHIGINIDDNYSKFLSVAMISILMNTDERLHFHILTSGLSQKNIQKLEKLKKIKPFEFEVINITDSRIATFPAYISKTITSVANYRLLTPIIKDDLDKIVYVDVDLVFLTDIKKLWDIDVEDYYVAATADYVNNYKQTEWIGKLPLPKNYLYFNSGVMIMNLKKMRKDNIVEKFFDDAEKYSDLLVLPDQDILNITLSSRVKYFDGIYNYMPEVQYIDKKTKEILKDNALVVHWAGLIKPWKLPGNEKSELFWQYAKYSPFYTEIKADYYISTVKMILSYIKMTFGNK